MRFANEEQLKLLNSSVRHIDAEVVASNGYNFTAHDALKSINIERIGESSKFFGFGVCQRLNVHLIDKNRELELSTSSELSVYFGTEDEKARTTPFFKVSEVHRDELTNELSVTAYDAIYSATEHTVEELQLEAPYTLADFVNACAAAIGARGFQARGFDAVEFSDMYFEQGTVNFEGTENLREALDAAAEATQSIYHL